MSTKVKRTLLLLLIILKDTGPTTACSSSCPSACDCSGSGLTSVPQDLPPTITILDLLGNAITSLRQSDFLRYWNLAYLHLGDNKISLIEGRALRNLTRLTELFLHKNQLSSLPADAFAGLVHLQVLDLYQNKLTALPADIFKGLSHLGRLDLYENELGSLSADIFAGLSNLTILDMYQNKLRSLPAGLFAGLGNLQELWLGENELTSLSADTFRGLGHLRELWLGRNRLVGLPAGIFLGLHNVTSLHLDSNQLTRISALTFIGLDKLEWLNIHRNAISSIDPGTFRGTPKLQHVDLEYNNINTISADAFVNLPMLQDLILSHNKIDAFPNIDDISSLSELRLEGNEMETLPAAAYDILTSIANVSIANNPWQCDCRMFSFKRRMTGSYAFERQITCDGPDNLQGKRLLQDVSLGDFICEQTTINSKPSTPSAVPSSSTIPAKTSNADSAPDLSAVVTPSTFQKRVKSTLPTASSSSRIISHSHPGKAGKSASSQSSMPVFVKPLLAAIAGTFFFCAFIFSVIYFWILKRPNKSPSGPSVMFSQTPSAVSALSSVGNGYSRLEE